MTKADKAEELFKSGLNCSQSVFCAFAEDLGLDLETAKKLSSGLGGGVGRLREVCGAVTGATLVIGMRRGPDKVRVYPAVQNFALDFKDACGSIVCRELLDGVGASTGGSPEARTSEYYRKRPCVEMVRLAAEILEKQS